MKQSSHPVIILGAGMSGLLAALLIKTRSPASQIMIVERSAVAGGHYREVELPGFGRCDRAMRLLYETGISELDAPVRCLLPEEQWHILPDNRKDIAGIYWRGALQRHSPYIDMRRLPAQEFKRCEADILARLPQNGDACRNAQAYLSSRFGNAGAGYLTRALEKFHSMPAASLDVCATFQPAMDRVILYGEERMRALLSDATLRARLAWPEQLSLPVKRHPHQCALYPLAFGMNRVIEALCAKLTRQGVQFLFNRAVQARTLAGGRITSLTLDDGSRFEPSHVVTTGGLASACALYRDIPILPAPPACWLVFLRVTAPPDMGELYHFYSYDDAYRTFRVTHYANYCPAARNAGGYPLCVELWQDAASPAQAIAQALRELRAMGIVAPDAEISAQAALRTGNLHGLCTVDYQAEMRQLRGELDAHAPGNLIATGPFVEEGALLLYQVLKDLHARISAVF